ncbi:hypothetical protein CHS0354_004245 [Potamilus streckersoni]|uniref:Uncharacterized protein n=1 Tax=Potamilus streckersoni TaxID=2493646 RepID=A0AAE0VQ35_9BIVA|nr:hypothetical protein CHS0354_004245 [Potamilus streckersoni]
MKQNPDVMLYIPDDNRSNTFVLVKRDESSGKSDHYCIVPEQADADDQKDQRTRLYPIYIWRIALGTGGSNGMSPGPIN